jgi:hypothetical protein
MKVLVAASLVLFSVSCAARESFLLVPQDKRVQRLESERNKLSRETDAVGRTKTQIKIADILLTFVSDAAKAGDIEAIEARLDEYTATIRDAYRTMIGTGRNAHQKPKGFKDLEIALRQQARQLGDIGGSLAFDQRAPVERARNEAVEIRDELLEALFGSQNAPSRS